MGFDFSLVDVFTDRPFGGNRLVFEEGIGPVRVDIDRESMRLYLDSPRYENSSEAPPTAEIARALSLPDDAISDSWYGGIGLKFCLVRLASPELVDRAVLDKDASASGVVGTWSAELYVFAGDFRDRGRAAVGNGGRVDRDPGAAGGPAARGCLTRAWREPRCASDDRVLVPLRRWAADRAWCLSLGAPPQ